MYGGELPALQDDSAPLPRPHSKRLLKSHWGVQVTNSEYKFFLLYEIDTSQFLKVRSFFTFFMGKFEADLSTLQTQIQRVSKRPIPEVVFAYFHESRTISVCYLNI